jgi:hypothetical protein
MKYRLILYSGIVSAIIGAIIGIGAVEISKDSLGQPRYKSQAYQELYKKYIFIGAGFGFTVGMGIESLRQLKEQRDKEEYGLEEHPDKLR